MWRAFATPLVPALEDAHELPSGGSSCEPQTPYAHLNAIQEGPSMKVSVSMLGTMLLVLVPLLSAAQGQPSTTAAQQPALAASATTGGLPPVVDAAAEPATKGQVDTLRASMSDLSAAVKKLAEKSKGPDFWTLGFGLFSSLFVAVVTFLGTRAITKSREKTDYDLAVGKSKLDVAKSLVDWKLRQLAELYGPLRTLFAQSNAIYRVMNMVLQAAAPEKFKLLTPDDLVTKQFESFKASADEDGHLFVISRGAGGAWERFRTVMFIDEAYGKGYEVELYFDQIVEISRRLVDVIETKAGLALNETGDEAVAGQAASGATRLQDTLRHKFGQYLAHAAVLQCIHANRRAVFRRAIGEPVEMEPLALNLATHVSAAFPQQIQRLVGTAYNELQRDVAAWAQRAQ
jgi:hypothetical protein